MKGSPNEHKNLIDAKSQCKVSTFHGTSPMVLGFLSSSFSYVLFLTRATTSRTSQCSMVSICDINRKMETFLRIGPLVYFLLVFNKWSGKSGLCWINDRPATLVFFCAPMLFVCVANIILYVLTVSSIDYVSSLTQVVHFTCFVFRNNIIILSQTSMETGVDQIFSFTSGPHISYTIYNIKYNFDYQDLRHSWHHLGFWHHRNYGN